MMMGFGLRRLAIAGVIAGLGTGAHAQGSWTTKRAMAAAINEVAVAAVGTKIHVLGGGVLGFAGPYHQEYDTQKDTWRSRAPLPKGLDHVGVTVANGRIYTVGGFIGSPHRDGQNAAYEYDPATDTWRILALMKAGRGSVGVAALNGKIYAVGGRNPDGRVVATFELYDPATNAWTELAPLPLARDHMAFVAAEGRLHAIGGRTGASTARTDRHDIFDPASNTWSSGPPLPTSRSGLAGTLYKGLILVLGGELPPNTFAENEAFNPKTNSWQTLTPMPHGRHATGAATSGNSVYLAAGSLRPGSGQVTNELIVFTLP
jgi:N-acetylneuraminic acid mutarotase